MIRLWSNEQPPPEQRTQAVSPRLVALALIVVSATWIRLHALGVPSIWLDEAVSIRVAQLDWHDFLNTIVASEGNMALYYVALRAWLHLGQSETVMRALSVLTGVATIPAVYLLGERLFSARIGLIAALLLALNAFHLRYSQEARSYSMLVLLVTLSGLFFARLCEYRSAGDWFGWVCFSILSVYAHFIAALVLAAQALSLLFLPSRSVPWKKLMAAASTIVLAVLPLAVYALRRGPGQLLWIEPISAHGIYNMIRNLAGAGGIGLVLAYSLALLLVAIAGTRDMRERSLQGWRFGFLLSWLFVPILAVLAISCLQPLLVSRYLIGCLPPLALLAAVALARLRPLGLQILALSAVLALANSAVVNYYGEVQHRKQNWRASTSYVSQNARAGDAILLFHGFTIQPFRYYWRQTPASVRIIPIRSSDAHLAGQLAAGHTRAWLFLSHCHQDLTGRQIESLLEGYFTPVAELRWPGLSLVLFERGGVPVKLSGCPERPWE